MMLNPFNHFIIGFILDILIFILGFYPVMQKLLKINQGIINALKQMHLMLD